MNPATRRHATGFLAIVTIALLSTVMVPGLGPTQGFAQVWPTPAVAGIQIAGMLSVPVPATLTTNLILNGMPFAAGQSISIIALPPGVSLHLQPGVIGLPPGTLVAIPGRPELGHIMLTGVTAVNVGVGLQATVPLASAPIFPGAGGAPFMGSHGTLLASTILGGWPFSAGERIDILSLPAGFILPMDGAVTLPPGTVVGVPARSDLGPIMLTVPARMGVDFAGLPGGPIPPAPMLPPPVPFAPQPVPVPPVPAAPIEAVAALAPEESLDVWVPYPGAGAFWPTFVTLSTPVVAVSLEPFIAADIEFPAELVILIIGLPEEIVLEPGTLVVLPVETAIRIPDWSDLGDVYLDSEAEVAVLE